MTSADILVNHAARLIGERAAVPKAVIILETMPLTAVGKIHKPSLRLLEVEAVTIAALAKAGIFDAAIRARYDDRLGNVVEVECGSCDEQSIQKALAAFSFKAFVTMEC